MGQPKLLLDEDVWLGLAEALREVGYDVVSVHELDRQGLSDEEQMAFAMTEGRTLVTHNIQDFAPLVADYFEEGLSHPGVIVSRQFEKGTLLRKTLALLESMTSDDLANTLRFV